MKSIIMYLALPITLILGCLYLIIFSDDVYRYPCQDPANWGTTECQPPACEAMGLCTKYLIDIPEGLDTTTPSSPVTIEPSVVNSSDAVTNTLNCSSDTPAESETQNECTKR